MSSKGNSVDHSDIQIYHEKQIKELCALHALNNLFQTRDSFTKAHLDTICHSLSPNVWINPHKSLLGLGNYDINVIMKALQEKGYEAIWFDKRRDPTCLNTKNITGFILNVPTEYKFGFILLPLNRRHWITIRNIGEYFYNLDSKLDSPHLIGMELELMSYLKEQLDCKDKELFIVVTTSVSESQSWLLSTATYNESNSMSERDADCVRLCDLVPEDFAVTHNPCHCSNGD